MKQLLPSLPLEEKLTVYLGIYGSRYEHSFLAGYVQVSCYKYCSCDYGVRQITHAALILAKFLPLLFFAQSTAADAGTYYVQVFLKSLNPQ